MARVLALLFFILFVHAARGQHVLGGKPTYVGRTHELAGAPLQRLVVGGSPVAEELRRSMAKLVMVSKTNSVYTCSASVINNKYLLTAAHCVILDSKENNNMDIKRSYALIGQKENDFFFSSSPENKIFWQRAFAASNYISLDYILTNDVALIELQTEIPNHLLYPMTLGSPPSATLPTVVSLAGYGRVASGANSSPQLYSAPVYYQKWKICIKKSPIDKSNVDSKRNVCLTTPGFPKVAQFGGCNGDSGGPSFYYDGTQYVQFGISSHFFGSACENPGTVFVYARVDKYTKIIQRGSSGGSKAEKGWIIYV